MDERIERIVQRLRELGHDELVVQILHYDESNLDAGTAGSGHWGHKSTPGMRGGSVLGSGGKMHRITLEDGTYSSEAKERAKQKQAEREAREKAMAGEKQPGDAVPPAPKKKRKKKAEKVSKGKIPTRKTPTGQSAEAPIEAKPEQDHSQENLPILVEHVPAPPAGPPSTVQGNTSAQEAAEPVQDDADDTPTGVGVLVVKDGMILNGRRVGEGTIGGPGGHIKEGETPEQAAIRETQEEFGITPTGLTAILKLRDANGALQSQVFLCTEYDGEVTCDEVEMTSPEFSSLGDLIAQCKSNPWAVFPPFARSLFRLMQYLIAQQYNCLPSVTQDIQGRLNETQFQQIRDVVEMMRSRMGSSPWDFHSLLQGNSISTGA